MKRIPLEQLRRAPGNLWHEAFAVGRLAGAVVEVPDDFGLEPAASPSRPVFFPDRLLSAAGQAARLAQCETCAKNVAGQCSLCRACGGRPVAHKVRRWSETCPLGRWPVV